MSEYTLIPYFSLRPDQLTIFARPESQFRTERQKMTMENLDNNENRFNELSGNARKRLQKSIDYMLYLTKKKNISGSRLLSKNIGDNEIQIEMENVKRNSKVEYQLTFITLTLSAKQHNTDEEIKSGLLNYFLRFLREDKKVELFIWKAEKQENGNIHFHILTDKFIRWQEIREKWNALQNKKGFGYVDAYSKNMQEFFKDGFKPFENDKRPISLQKEIYEKNKLINWTNPNSTDIHAIYKIKNMGAYMSKYLSKGVTKTNRVERLKELYSLIEKNEILIDKLDTENMFMYETDYSRIVNEQKIENIKEENKTIEIEIKRLMELGVSGRIWGQSQKLSKIKNFTDMGTPEQIPDFNLVTKQARYKHSLDVGSNTVTTYYFDIEKTPGLRSLLDTHISQTYRNQLL